MSRHGTLHLTANGWTQLTAGDVTAITFQNLGPYEVHVVGTATASEPSDLGGALRYGVGQGEANGSLSDLWPGITAVRVWAWSDTGGQVMVSHA